MTQFVENIAGYFLTTMPESSCVSEIVEGIKIGKNQKSCRWLACFNPHSFVVATNDPFFSQALHRADWLIPDGIGIVYASKLLGGKIRQRVTGSDIFQGVLTELNDCGGFSVFFLGSTPQILETICQRMALDYPNIRIVGTYSPPFKDDFSIEEREIMLNVINAVAPDVLWVGMTAPKQEKWLYQNAAQLNVRFAAAVGAVFDFYSGRVKRSHPIFQRMGLEWLPRLLQQPFRLWRRMGISAPIFIWHILRQKISQ